MMESVSSSETSVNIYQTTRCNISEHNSFLEQYSWLCLYSASLRETIEGLLVLPQQVFYDRREISEGHRLYMAGLVYVSN
jgi:hypothetical protein